MIRTVDNGLLVNIRIIPNSSKNAILIEDNDDIKIKITAQPIENKANKALIEYLSKELKLPKSCIEIVKGSSSRDKVIFLKTADEDKRKQIAEILKKV